MGVHGVVEFSNRLLTFALSAVVVAAVEVGGAIVVGATVVVDAAVVVTVVVTTGVEVESSPQPARANPAANTQVNSRNGVMDLP